MKPILSIIYCFFYFCLFAQQRPHYTQYIVNSFILNPAIAGIENYTDVKVSHRHQWVGLDGAPVTSYLTIQGPLKKNDYDRETVTTIHPPDENPIGHANWKENGVTDPHHGIGFTLLNDRTGPLNRFSITGSYAYHLPIGESINLSGGISLGIQNMGLNAQKLDFGSVNPIDPSVYGSGSLNKLLPDINAGLYLYSSNYFVGLAAQNIVPSKLSYADNSVKMIQGNLIPHLFLSAGYRFMLDDDISLLPSVMLKYITPLPIGFDFNAKLQYRDFIWLGSSYRVKDGFAAMLGVNLNSSFNFGYSYDITTSGLQTVSRGSHELLIGFLINNHYGDWCPRNVW